MSLNDLRKKLSEELETAEWSWLEPHYKRDAVIVVSPDLELLDVAVAIGSNDLKQVAEWMKTNLVRKPFDEQIETWSAAPTTPFLFIIVQPWVLIQAKAN